MAYIIGLFLFLISFASLSTEITIDNAPFLRRAIEEHYNIGEEPVSVLGEDSQVGLPTIYLKNSVDDSIVHKIVLRKDTKLKELQYLLTNYLPRETKLSKSFYFFGNEKEVKTKRQKKFEKELFKQLKDLNELVSGGAYTEGACQLVIHTDEQKIQKKLELAKDEVGLGEELAEDLLSDAVKVEVDYKLTDNSDLGIGFKRTSERLDRDTVVVTDRVHIPYRMALKMGQALKIPIGQSTNLGYVFYHRRKISRDEFRNLPSDIESIKDFKSGLLGVKKIPRFFSEFGRSVKEQLKIQLRLKDDAYGFASSMFPTTSKLQALEPGSEKHYELYGQLSVNGAIGTHLTGVSGVVSTVSSASAGGSGYVGGSHVLKIKKLNSNDPNNVEIKISNNLTKGKNFYVNGDVVKSRVALGPLSLKMKVLDIKAFNVRNDGHDYNRREIKFRVNPASEDGKKALKYMRRGEISEVYKLAKKSSDVTFREIDRRLGKRKKINKESFFSKVLGLKVSKNSDVGESRLFDDNYQHKGSAQYARGDFLRRTRFLQNKESFNREYLLQSNYHAKDQSGVDTINFTLKSRLYDHISHGEEINKAVDDIKNKFGVKVLEKLPEETFSGRKIDYGRFDINTELKVSAKTINEFLDVPEDKMWQMISESFGEENRWKGKERSLLLKLKSGAMGVAKSPLTLVGFRTKKGTKYWKARKLLKQWKKASQAKKSDKRIEALSEVFGDNLYRDESLKLLQKATSDDPISLKIYGGNQETGDIYFEKKTTWDDLLKKKEEVELARKEINFIKINEVAIVGKSIYVYFDADQTPSMVHIKMKYRFFKYHLFHDELSTPQVESLGNKSYRIKIKKIDWLNSLKEDSYSEVKLSATTNVQKKYKVQDRVKLKTRLSIVELIRKKDK